MKHVFVAQIKNVSFKKDSKSDISLTKQNKSW
jgi:hypothetical protein